MKEPKSTKTGQTLVTEARVLGANAKAAAEQAEAVKQLARLAKRRLKQARRDYKLARRAARKARMEAKDLQAAALAASRKAESSRKREARRAKQVSSEKGHGAAPKAGQKGPRRPATRSRKTKGLPPEITAPALEPPSAEVSPAALAAPSSPAGEVVPDAAPPSGDLSPLPDESLE
jgi:multidrug efflux pump subunit AcrA (membrane-fusion protein)